MGSTRQFWSALNLAEGREGWPGTDHCSGVLGRLRLDVFSVDGGHCSFGPFCPPLPGSPEAVHGSSVHDPVGSGVLVSSVNRELHVARGPTGSSRVAQGSWLTTQKPWVEAF